MTEREQGIAILVPLAAILFIPLAGVPGVSSRLGAVFVELLVGLPCLMLLPGVLRRDVFPLRCRVPALALAPLLFSLAIAYQLLYTLLARMLPVPENQVQRIQDSFQVGSPAEGVLLALSVLVFAPVMEEVFFRGFLPWAWAERYGQRGMLLVPALVFAVLHVDPWHLPDLFLLGLGLGVLRFRLNSLVPAIGLHAFNNLLSLVQLRTSGTMVEDFLAGSGTGPPWLALLCALPGGLWLLILGLRRPS